MKISVVIPAYNAELYIERTLSSLKKQTYTNIQVIVVNDGSTDSTGTIVSNFIKMNKQCDISLINIKNGGLANARNVGLSMCTGEFYINLDADDYIEDDTFEKAMASFQSGIDVCFYGYKSFEVENEFFDFYEDSKHYLEEPVTGLEAFKMRIKKHIWICQGNAIYRMSLLKDNNILNKPGFNQGEDMYFISKCLLNANYVTCFKGDNFCCMTRKDSMNHSSYNESFFQVIQLLKSLRSEVATLTYTKEEKQEINEFIDFEYIVQYLALVKRAARYFSMSDYIGNFKKIPFSLDGINLNIGKKKLTKLKRLELNMFSMSKRVYYLFVKLYDRRGAKHE